MWWTWQKRTKGGANLVTVMVWKTMTPIGSYIQLLSHQEVEILERIRGIRSEVWPCWRESVTGVSKAHASSTSLSVVQDIVISYCSGTMLPCHEDNGPNLWNCKQTPIKFFLHSYGLHWLWCLFIEIEQQLSEWPFHAIRYKDEPLPMFLKMRIPYHWWSMG